MSDDIRVGSIWESKGSGMLARVVAYDPWARQVSWEPAYRPNRPARPRRVEEYGFRYRWLHIPSPLADFHADRTCSCGGQGTAWNDTGTEHGSEPITCDCVHTLDNRCTPDCVEVD